jgi:hypothetical protein
MPLLNNVKTALKGRVFCFLRGNTFGSYNGLLSGYSPDEQMRNAIRTMIKSKKDFSDKDKDSIENRLSLPFSGFSANLYYEGCSDPINFISDADGFHIREEAREVRNH